MFVLVVGLAGGGRAELAARIGSKFADVYAAGAPLVALYRSYADHLFLGTAISIPTDLEVACEPFARELAELHVQLVTQTGSVATESLAAVVRLRADVACFCASYQPMLEAMASVEVPAPDLLERASEADLFASIADLNDGLEEVLSFMLDETDDREDRWRLAAAFAVRTLVHQPTVERIGEGLVGILYGAEGVSEPLIQVPAAIADAIAALGALSGRSLSPEEAEEAVRLAECIHGYLVDDVVALCTSE